MKVNILAFGQVAGVTGNSPVIEESVADTKALQTVLHKQFPSLNEMKYSIAVDKKIVHENTELKENAIVALLPPFSGG